MEPKRIELDGVVYELRPWTYADGKKWAFRLVRALAPAIGAHGTERDAIASVLDGIDEATLVAFSETCEGYTNLITHDDAGRELVRPLSKVAAVHMAGRYWAMAALMKAHAEAQFGDFFARLGELFRSGAAAETKAG
jgi:hypothetical protein